MFKARTGQYPSSANLGVGSLALKGVGERFEPGSQRLGVARQLRVRSNRRWPLRRFGTLLDDLVGQQQSGKQELARFGQCAETGERFAALAIDEASGGAQILLLALAASDLVSPAGDRNVDQGGHQAAASRISWSSSATASRTRARSSSSRPSLTGGRSASARSIRSRARSARSRAVESGASSMTLPLRN